MRVVSIEAKLLPCIPVCHNNYNYIMYIVYYLLRLWTPTKFSEGDNLGKKLVKIIHRCQVVIVIFLLCFVLGNFKFISDKHNIIILFPFPPCRRGLLVLLHPWGWRLSGQTYQQEFHIHAAILASSPLLSLSPRSTCCIFVCPHLSMFT